MKQGLRIFKKFLLLAAVASLPLHAAWAGPEEVERAAQSGDVEAQLEMGILYEFGFPAAKNNVTALAWYMLAAESGNAKAIARRDRLMSRLSPEEVERARRESRTLVSGKPAEQLLETPAPAEAKPGEAPTQAQ